MIAFGSPISSADAFSAYAEPGIELVREPDSQVLAFAAVDPTGRSYNLILDAAARIENLEALVFVHAHTEMTDPELPAKLRAAFADPDVGVVGSAGATGVRSLAWWEGRVVAAPGRQQYNEFGGGEIDAFSWLTVDRPGSPFTEVEAVDHQLFAVSPWVVQNVRFDEGLIFSHGFEVDFCLQVRAAGRKVVVADLAAVHHRSLELLKDIDLWAEAHVFFQKKWDHLLHDSVPADEQGWKRRARRAEAERESARAVAFSRSLKLDARVLELERELDEALESVSWRLTRPLRAVNRMRRDTVGRLRGAEAVEDRGRESTRPRWRGRD